MAKSVILSKQGQLKWRDALRGLILAVGTPVLYYLQELIPHYNLDPIVKIGISAGITYIIKNFLEPAKVITTYDTNTKAEEIAKDLK